MGDSKRRETHAKRLARLDGESSEKEQSRIEVSQRAARQIRSALPKLVGLLLIIAAVVAIGLAIGLISSGIMQKYIERF